MNSLSLMEILQLTFAQRVILGGVIIALLSAIMGFFVSLRKEHFFGETMAHSALAGIALGVLINFNPLLIALVYAVSVSLALPWLQKKSGLETNNLLGIVLPFSTSLGVILFSLNPGYQPELVSFLFGNISWISWNDIFLLLLLAAVLGVVVKIFWPKLTFISIDPQYARLLGIKAHLYDLAYNFMLALVIIAGVRLVGIVLVNALLIIPASTAKLLASSLKEMFWLSIVVSLLSVLSGVLFAFIYNWPSGATIALASSLIFLLAILVKNLSDTRKQ